MPRRNSGKRLRETENGAEQNGDAKIRFRRRKCRRKRWACWGVEKGAFVGKQESKWEKKAASIYPPPNLLNKIVKNFRLKRARIHELPAGSRQ